MFQFEMASKNHELVATKMVNQLAGLRSMSRTERCIGELAKAKCVKRLRNASYEGWILTYLGYDYLSLKAFVKRDTVGSVGNQIGVGKESDIYIVADPNGHERVLKIHRLGRVSFRTVKQNREYMGNRKSASWMYLSRLSAAREYQVLQGMYDAGFPVPRPLDYSRHCVLMDLVPGFPMRQLSGHDQPGRLYMTCMNFIIKLAEQGLIHGDFNEFNIMIRDDYDPEKDDDEKEMMVIDLPQSVSIEHRDAQFFFERDVESIQTFFERKLGYVPEDGWAPDWERDITRKGTLDVQVQAAGMTKKQAKDLEKALAESRENMSDDDEGDDEGVEDEEEASNSESDDEGELLEVEEEHLSD